MARVLVVEDSPTDSHVLKGMLERNGYTVSWAQTAEEGLRRAREERPDVVLMDIILPGGMNGFQATRKLVRDPATASMPVIIVTTKLQETDRVWGLRQGAKEYITKPVDEQELIAKIAGVIGR
jgi:twitching motility two-component system response regulator PilH